MLCGVQSSDLAQQSTGPALAAVLGFPCVSAVTSVEIEAFVATVRRELDGGLIEIVEVDLPAVLTVQTGLNTPREGSFRHLIQAKKTPIEVVDPGETGTRTTIRRMALAEPSGKRAQMIDGGPTEVAKRIVELIRETGV